MTFLDQGLEELVLPDRAEGGPPPPEGEPVPLGDPPISGGPPVLLRVGCTWLPEQVEGSGGGSPGGSPEGPGTAVGSKGGLFWDNLCCQ